MPSIDVAMERSLRRGAVDLLAAAIRPVIERRNIITDTQGQITDARQAFSSWDNCMKANFCKWPVIAIIVVGGLILFSVIWCIIRCACCGMSCCCSCFQCLKCCGNCCGACDPPGPKRNKYLDDQFAPPNHEYRSEAPMTAGPVGGGTTKSPLHEPPQYAEFDMGKKGGEDALPQMPSWESAGSKKVVLDDEPVEMENLRKPENNEAGMPLMTGASPEGRSPYGPQGGSYHGSNAYVAGGGAGTGAPDPYARNGPGYNNNNGYDRSASSLAVDQGYGMAGAAAIGPGRRSPRGYNGGSGEGGYGAPNPGYMDSRSRQGSYGSFRRNGATPQPGYGMARREPTIPDVMGGGAYGEQPRRSPGPQQQRGDYGYGGRGRNNGPYAPPQRQWSSDSTRPLNRPPPHRDFSNTTLPPPSPTASLQNNAGFDFNSGYSRPPTQGRDQYERRPSGGQQGAGDDVAYPGYKAYQPPTESSRQQHGWSGV